MKIKTKTCLSCTVFLFLVLCQTDSLACEAGEIKFFPNCVMPVPEGFSQSKINKNNYHQISSVGVGGIRLRRQDSEVDFPYDRSDKFAIVYKEKVNGLTLYSFSYVIGSDQREIGVIRSGRRYMEVSNMDIAFLKELALSCK